MNQAVLVIGAGIASIQAFIDLAQMGFQVYLVEKETHLGGRLPHINRLCPANEQAARLIEPIIQEVERHEEITLHMPATIKEVSGYVGNFQVISVANGSGQGQFDVGTIIVATGANVLQPVGMYGCQTSSDN